MILTKDEVVKMARQVWPEVSAGAPMPDGLERFTTLCRAPLVAEVERLAGREQVLKKATALDWTAIMREGSLVTWGDAETLGCRVVEHIRALAASPQEQQP